MNNILHFIHKPYNFNNKAHIQRKLKCSVYNRSEAITYLTAKIPELVPDFLKELKSLVLFKNEMKQWARQKCQCRLN